MDDKGYLGNYSNKLVFYGNFNTKKNHISNIAKVLDTSVRDVNGYILTFKTPTNLFYFNLIKKEIERLFFHYKIKFPKLSSDVISQIELLSSLQLKVLFRV